MSKFIDINKNILNENWLLKNSYSLSFQKCILTIMLQNIQKYIRNILSTKLFLCIIKNITLFASFKITTLETENKIFSYVEY